MNELFSAAGPPGAKEKIASCCKAPSEGKTLRAGKSNTWTAVAFGLLHLDDESYAKHKKAHDACCLFGEELEVDYAT